MNRSRKFVFWPREMAALAELNTKGNIGDGA